MYKVEMDRSAILTDSNPVAGPVDRLCTNLNWAVMVQITWVWDTSSVELETDPETETT